MSVDERGPYFIKISVRFSCKVHLYETADIRLISRTHVHISHISTTP